MKYYSRATASFARPANTTQYAAGDLVANSATAGSVTAMTFAFEQIPAGGFTKIITARMWKSDLDVTAANFRLHLFSASPVSTAPSNGDNEAIAVAVDEAGYIGSINFDMTTSGGVSIFTGGNAAVGTPMSSREIVMKLPGASNAIYGLVEATGTYTPASGEVFTVELIAEAL